MSNFKVIHRLTLNCKKEVKCTQVVKKWCGLKSVGEKSWEIKDGRQEWLHNANKFWVIMP